MQESRRLAIRNPSARSVAIAAVVTIFVLVGLRIGLPLLQRQRAMRDIRAVGGTVRTKSPMPDWLATRFGGEWTKFFDRPTGVYMDDRSLGRPATNADLALVERLTSLRSLEFQGESSITDSGLVHLAALDSLGHLYLNSPQVTDAGLVHIGRLTSLEGLILCRTQITDSGVVHLRGLHKLTDLCITSRGLVHLSSLNSLTCLPSLRCVCMQGVHVHAGGLAALERMPELRELVIMRTSATDEDFSGLEKLTRLQALNLSGTRITDSICSRIAPLRDLEWLTLEGTDITDAALERLCALSKLKEVNLASTRVSDAAMKELKRIRPDISVLW
jgi:hypothetical protein